jgi:sortase A
MRVLIQCGRRRPRSGSGFMRAAGYFFFLLGCLAIGFCAFVYLQAQMFQERAESQFEKLRKTVQPTWVASKDRETARRLTIGDGSPLSRLDIPRLGLSVMVVEGTQARNLKVAVGHIPGTAHPDELGNVGIAGHRDTFFRKLGEIHREDRMTLTTLAGSYRYAVEWARVVDSNDVAVLRTADGHLLTLVTCYPFYYVGPAPKRFVVRARRCSDDSAASPRLAAQ